MSDEATHDPLMPSEDELLTMSDALVALAGHSPKRYVCRLCGALVISRETHDAYHRRIEGDSLVDGVRQELTAQEEGR